MSGGLTRRDALGAMAAIPLAAGLRLPAGVVERAARAVEEDRRAPAPHTPRFFTPHEWRTVRLLADLVIPRDERSGSATDAGVPEFIDFVMIDQPEARTAMRGGLAWLDHESRQRFDRRFADATSAQHAAILDDIAWPARAPAALSQGVAFFNNFRDLVASGFWSSRMGVEDLQYLGNRTNAEWNGCPKEALEKLGVEY